MIQLWHGGRRWVGGPEIQPPRAGKYECGPGIYLTTRYHRARSYTGGSGVTTLVTLREPRWLEQRELPLAKLEAFVRETPRFRKRDAVLADLEAATSRLGRDTVPVSYLVNLGVNHDALAGNVGLQMASWLADQGIDASLYNAGGQEQWVVVFNPKIITEYRTVSASDVALDLYELPRVVAT